MQNEEIFEAEAEIENAEHNSKGQQELGKKAITVATGDIDSRRRDREGEESPLLGEGYSSPVGSNFGGSDDDWPGDRDFVDVPWHKRPSIYWLLPCFLVYALAFGGIIVPKLNLYVTLICREYMSDKAINDPSFTFLPVIYGDDNPQCRIPEVSARVAQFTLAGQLISGILSAIVSPKLGALSDRYGRKRILIYCSAGMFVTELITIAAATRPDTFPSPYLLLGFLAEGLCGSFIASMAISNSYAADCTPPHKRNVVFGFFHGCLFTGIALGPILAAYLIELTGTVVTVFYVALGVHIFFIIVLIFVIPESLSVRRQLAAQEKHRLEMEELGPAADWINQLRSFNLLAPLKILYPTGPGTNVALRRNLVLLAAVDTIMFGVAMGAMSIIVIYTNYKFGWGNFESSRFVSIVNSCRVACLLILMPLLTRIVRGPAATRPRQRNTGSDLFDLSVIRLAIVFDMMGFVGYSIARDGTLFIISGAIASAGGIGSPTMQAALTKHVPHDRVGQLLGASGLLHALARVVAPTIFNGIYSATVGKFDQTVFVCLAATFGVAFVCSWFVRPHGMFSSHPPRRLGCAVQFSNTFDILDEPLVSDTEKRD
ncbi:MFS general substrate transporter [Rhizodiscina lignyota]|uniref:MFS general substrate transporter n=1 Tax=Rhizodiscina lignyota TaxID=1504668 RepID=A0A9P4M0D9_9PEZI|nr:MFS general substrate transporter [Rhizodiscina lignyota]